MRWEITTRYQTMISLDGEYYKVTCEDDGGIMLSINDEYVKDLDCLPKEGELIEHIKEYAQIEDWADIAHHIS